MSCQVEDSGESEELGFEEQGEEETPSLPDTCVEEGDECGSEEQGEEEKQSEPDSCVDSEEKEGIGDFWGSLSKETSVTQVLTTFTCMA